MRKEMFFLILLSIFSANTLFAVELWNGFTTEMTREAVISRARTALELNEYEESSSGGNWTQVDFRIFGVNRSNRRHLNATFPPYELSLKYIATNEMPFSSVTFFFRNNLLFAVWVYPRMFIEDFLPTAINNYGQVTETFIEQDPGLPGNSFANPWQRTWYRWRTQGKIIYTNGGISGDRRGHAPLIIFEQRAIEIYARERQEAENRRREQAASGFSF